ncbi:CAP domain-containing protein [Aquipuribacter sp. MA13-6]|uniref:CAP domain-containing protein n=1 Tax=unclassified Aquipuribacter TaxID=2635084 RepID=UPI003EE8F348
MPSARPRPRPRRRAVLATFLGLVTVAASLTGGATPASASAGEVVALVAAERSASGLPALRTSGDLGAVAQRWAGQLASSGSLAHNPDLGQEVDGWSAVAENVGTGTDVGTVHGALMDSPGHRANILGGHTQVGVGVATGHDAVWVVQVFRTPSGAAPEPAGDAPVPGVPEPGTAAPGTGEDDAPAEPDRPEPDAPEPDGPATRPAPTDEVGPHGAAVAREATDERAPTPPAAQLAWVERSERLRAVGGRGPAWWCEPWPT